MKTARFFSCMLAFVGVAGSAMAQVTLAGFDTADLTSFGPSPWNATSLDGSLVSAALTRGSGLSVSNPPANVWGGTGFEEDALGDTQAEAIANGDHFLLTLDLGLAVVDLHSLTYNIRRSSTAPDSFRWQFSDDNDTFTDLGPGPVSYSGTQTDGLAQPLLSLTSLPSQTGTIYFRLVPWGADGTTGSFGFGRLSGDDLQLTGTAIPEPSTYAAILGAVTLGIVVLRRRFAKSGKQA